MAFSYSGDWQAELIGFAAVVANHDMVVLGMPNKRCRCFLE